MARIVGHLDGNTAEFAWSSISSMLVSGARIWRTRVHQATKQSRPKGYRQQAEAEPMQRWKQRKLMLDAAAKAG